MYHDELASSTGRKSNDSRGFIHKRIGGAIGGFVRGGFTGAARGFISGGRATRPTTALQIPGGGSQRRERTFRLGPFGPSFQSTTTSRFTVPPGTGTAIGEIIGVGLDRAARGPVLPTADGCPKGFHLNKSAYSLKSGERIEERTLCVKNRRRNNDNGAAALRAARRLVGRKKHQETVDKALRAIAPKSRRSSSRKQPSHGGATVISAG